MTSRILDMFSDEIDELDIISVCEATEGEEPINYTEHANEQMPLNEMATLIDTDDGYGIIIKINSNDHRPAHMHVINSKSQDLIAKVIIPSSKPSSTNSIRPYKGYTLTEKMKKIILDALLSKDKELEAPTWKVAKRTWNMLHPDCPI
ncbi:MAG: DUF4160 domain-containing protein [bacterium]|nr:DUF4160 domain-containing protein [bacterium]